MKTKEEILYLKIPGSPKRPFEESLDLMKKYPEQEIEIPLNLIFEMMEEYAQSNEQQSLVSTPQPGEQPEEKTEYQKLIARIKRLEKRLSHYKEYTGGDIKSMLDQLINPTTK